MRASRSGLGGLPPGFTFGPGYVTVQFDTAVESLEKFMALVIALARPGGLEEYEALVGRRLIESREAAVCNCGRGAE
jgi:hypothetical protein